METQLKAISPQEQEKVLSPQELRIEQGESEVLTTEDARVARARVNRMLKGFRDKPPRVAVDRARLMVESLKETEGLPIVLRWAKALGNVMEKIEVYIGDDELLVGRAGPSGRYGILYPELRGAWLEEGLDSLMSRKEGAFIFTDEDARIIREEIIPYWKGRTVFEANYRLLPPETRRLLYQEDDPYSPTYILLESTTDRTSLQWSLDYEKVLKRGFNGIRKEAEERLAALDPLDVENNMAKRPFLESVIIVCRAIVTFARKHAELARNMAEKTGNALRKKELLEIAEICDWVPGNPARTFREAIQSQWFAQVASRFEGFHGGTIGNGRIDQYLYPYYKKDIAEGRMNDEEVLELFENLWLNMAQNTTFRQSGNVTHQQAYPHFEHTTIGGQTRDGQDATNELSYLILQSKKEFPLNYPDLSARIHARTPESFLHAICELIKEGSGFPKLFNDEEIIPLYLAKGASLEEARDYTGSGCTEVRILNRDIYMTGNILINLGACVEMALSDGRLRLLGNKRFGVSTGDPRGFGSFDEFNNAFKAQFEYLARHVFIQNQIADMIRPHLIAAPIESCLHDLCMKDCVDIHQGKLEGGMILGSLDPIGFGTAVDSLAAIKKLVYEDKTITMDELIEALEKNFEGKEVIRQLCLNAPKYGNNDPYVDSIGREMEDYFRSLCGSYTTLYGGKLDLRYVPVTSHVPLGAIIGATPNGRRAKDSLSEGISPSQGADTNGPTACLLSVAKTKESKHNHIAARLLNLKLTPQAVSGKEGTKRLAALIRTWCDLKLWHIQFNIINRETLIAAQKNPEKYRNLLVRVAGYSAYFVDLSPSLQKEVIQRTGHTFTA